MHAVASYQREAVQMILDNSKPEDYLHVKSANGNTVRQLLNVGWFLTSAAFVDLIDLPLVCMNVCVGV